MNRLARRRQYLVVIMFLIAIFLFSMVIRYPFVPHESGYLVIHSLAQSVSDSGYAKWIIHPLSYAGLYPYSYPSAVPFILSETSMITSLDIENSVFIFSLLCGIFCALFMFLLLKEISGDFRVALSGAFFYTLAPTIVDQTMWNNTSRNLFMVLLPFVIWLLIKVYKSKSENKRRTPFILLILLTSVTLLFAHRLAIYLVGILLAFIVVHFIIKLPMSGMIKNKTTRRVVFKYAIGVLIFVFIIGIILLQYTDIIDFYKKIRWEMKQLYPGDLTIINYMYNIIKFVSQGTGLGIIFLPIGLWSFSFKQRKKFEDYFIFLCFTGALLIIIVPIYSIMIFVPLACIYCAVGFIKTYSYLRSKSRSIVSLFVVTILLSTGVCTKLITDYWNSRPLPTTTKSVIDNELYSTIIYVKQLDGGGMIGTRTDISEKFTGYGLSCLPYYDPMALVNGNLVEEDIEIVPAPSQSLFYGILQLYIAKPTIYEDPEISWRYFMTHYPDETSNRIQSTYNIHYIMEDVDIGGKILYSGVLTDSAYLTYASFSKYQTYQCQELILWYI